MVTGDCREATSSRGVKYQAKLVGTGEDARYVLTVTRVNSTTVEQPFFYYFNRKNAKRIGERSESVKGWCERDAGESLKFHEC